MITLKPLGPAPDPRCEVLLTPGHMVTLTNDPSLEGPRYIFMDGMRYDRVEIQLAVVSNEVFAVCSVGDSPVLYSTDPFSSQRPHFKHLAHNQEVRITKPDLLYLAIPCINSADQMSLAHLYLAFSTERPAVRMTLYIPTEDVPVIR